MSPTLLFTHATLSTVSAASALNSVILSVVAGARSKNAFELDAVVLVRTFPLDDGNVNVVPSVPLNANVLLAVSVFPEASVNVAFAPGFVNTTPFIDVAVELPMIGVINVGDVSKTNFPAVPVSSLIIPARFADVIAVIPE